MKLSKIAQMTDRAGLRNLMDNAKRLGRDDVYWAAFNRFCALEGIVHDDPLTRDFYNVLNAYEGPCQTNANQVEFVIPGFRWTAQNTCDFQQPLGD